MRLEFLISEVIVMSTFSSVESRMNKIIVREHFVFVCQQMGVLIRSEKD